MNVDFNALGMHEAVRILLNQTAPQRLTKTRRFLSAEIASSLAFLDAAPAQGLSEATKTALEACRAWSKGDWERASTFLAHDRLTELLNAFGRHQDHNGSTMLTPRGAVGLFLTATRAGVQIDLNTSKVDFQPLP